METIPFSDQFEKTDLNFFVWYQGAALSYQSPQAFWSTGSRLGYEQESQTFFSLLISDSSLELSSTVPTGYFFLSISRTDLWSQGKDDNTNTLQRRCKIWFSDVPDVITIF